MGKLVVLGLILGFKIGFSPSNRVKVVKKEKEDRDSIKKLVRIFLRGRFAPDFINSPSLNKITLIMKKLIFTLAVILCFVFAAQAQSSYKTAIGLRLGYPAAISLKHFLNEKGAVEAFVGFRGYLFARAINLGAMYQHHTAIAEVEGLKWYVGGGAAAWIWTYDNDFVRGKDYNNLNLALMGCLGLDYKFVDLPINLSVDWVPTLVVGESGYGSGFGFGYGALSGRYTFR